ncbi:uncharacterized protein LOC101458389 isoform X1 [Ceratitis capitata]|uniref:Disks large-associated protein 1 n=1 Tax=Ceratitis capitata TaxID=7213 RepID=W8BCN7_CERCA|nr:uncharacterized protein LOC101458389 isoform X1 [Ceratitis capitata]XP_004526280.1 uncharacterized protein LOC101458389 isoform X1 [Ceratitis capitata]XP_004526282.1 uncharacterized protein LOC101458389 isoform X1 [Ceratitis capitata]XP_020714838.1 uncharacterized protein LOC101458389 isoform X1 [Ceratitis capitata]XP_020714839.1 uncharacterized protein LOC101458389 isoform X1 [Ceratitis capitata]XP_020714840.1 uncharacterized protein LOC101458389 isoform X1 [Ceratitis capitata]XP_02071484
MDRSVDSIGSCSLDVDADSTDVSDTSGSMNFPTPISVKDITREFTTNIRERCAVQNFHENIKTIGLEQKMVLKQPLGNVNNTSALLNSSNPHSNKMITLTDVSPDKKPSYLNLACCVNGYSNLTTYDSKIRQDINKSREVSPIRPSSNCIQYCKKSDSLAPPILLKMDDGRGDVANMKPNLSNGQCNNFGYKKPENNKYEDNESHFQDGRRNTSFIQQRVERLYGPAALAQRFYSPKKVRSSNFTCSPAHDLEDASSSELARKFQQLTPSKDYTEFRKKLSATTSNCPRQIVSTTDISNVNNNNVDLPVFRHLSQEFRAQLPLVSPKKYHSRNSPNKSSSIENDTTAISQKNKVLIDEVDRKEVNFSADQISNKYSINEDNTEKNFTEGWQISDVNNTCTEKNGTYFLQLLRNEQSRLLALADIAEQYAIELSGNPEISEDTLGFLRSAYGKARLLVSQKMKQFEGLCQNNLNSSPDDKFPTTNDDLQGFWDMVYLQVDHINSIFDEINVLKENNWKKSDEIIPKEKTKLSKPQPKSTKTPSQKTKSSTTNGNESKEKSSLSAAALKRESQRKMLLEMKRKNKIALSAKSTTSDLNSVEPNVENVDTVEIFVKNSK